MKTITIVLEGKDEVAYDDGIKLLKQVRKQCLGPDITNGELASMLTGGLFSILDMIAKQMKLIYKEMNNAEYKDN